jgi:hypothetical protein
MNQFVLSLFVILVVGFAIFYLFLIMRKKKRADLINFASYIGLGIAFFVVLHVIILMVYPFKIQDVEEPLKVVNPNNEVKRGEFLQLQIHINKYVDLPSVVSPSIICENGYYYIYPDLTSNLPIGEQTFTVANIFKIPMEAPLSECRVRVTDRFQLNIFRSNTTANESDEFRIIE